MTKKELKIRTIIFIIIPLVVLAGVKCFAGKPMKDSILTVILEAKEGRHINSIKADVGPKILALNNWTNDALWNQPDIVKEVAEELIPYAIAEKNDSLLSWLHHYLGISYHNMHFWNLSIDTYKKALKTNWAKNSESAGSFRAFCNLNIGCNYEMFGNYDKAASYYYNSIRMNEDLGIPYVAAEAKLDLASLYIRMNNHNEARKYVQEAIGVLKRFNDSVRVSEAYRLMSSIEISDHNYMGAENYFNQALEIGNQLNDNERLVKIYLSYGDALFSQNQLQNALETYRKALGYCAPTIFPASYFQTIGGLGKVHVALNQFDKAEENLRLAYDGLSKLKSNTLLLEIEENLTNLYAKKGDYELFQYIL